MNIKDELNDYKNKVEELEKQMFSTLVEFEKTEEFKNDRNYLLEVDYRVDEAVDFLKNAKAKLNKAICLLIER